MAQDISKKVINKIKKEKIVPSSKFQLNWKNYLIWIILIFLVLMGALFSSLAIFNIPDVDLEIYRYLKLRRFAWLIIGSAPLLWIIFLFFSLTLGFLAFRKTKRGYRYKTLLIVGIIVFAVLSLGFLAHWAKFNQRLDENFSRRIPHYRQFAPQRGMRWINPEEGFLAGKIIAVKSEELTVASPKNGNWIVKYNKKTLVDPEVKLEQEEIIKAIGEKIGDFIFQAQIIKKLPCPGMFPQKGSGNQNNFLK